MTSAGQVGFNIVPLCIRRHHHNVISKEIHGFSNRQSIRGHITLVRGGGNGGGNPASSMFSILLDMMSTNCLQIEEMGFAE